MFPVPRPPVRAAPPNAKLVRVEVSAILFPSSPLFRAVMITVAAGVAVTPIGPPSDAILAARLLAFTVFPAPVLTTTRKLLPVLLPAAVKTSETAPCLIVKVPVGVPAAANVFPPRLAAVVGKTPARLVLKTTKSFAQLGVALISKVNLAGNIPAPTVPPASIDAPQSPGAFTLAIVGPSDGSIEF